MAPFWKIYDKDGEYEAACKSPESAAALVSFLGEGATIRFDHAKKCTAWTEGADGCASDSYDRTAELCLGRLEDYRKAQERRYRAMGAGKLGDLTGRNNPFKNLG